MSSRKFLTKEDYTRIANEWQTKSIEELAQECQVTPNTIRKAAATLRKHDPGLCSTTKRKTRDDLAKEAIAILKNRRNLQKAQTPDIQKS